jgi:methionine-gamma-lyase
MTKSLNGHADVVAGVVIVKNEEDYAHFRKTLNHTGGTIDPFNAFLVHRGIKTLKLRVEKQAENAQKVAEFLENHTKVAWVRYPGLPSHKQHELAKKQMKGFGCLMSFELKGGLEAGKTMMDNVDIYQLAGMTKENREKAHITDGLVRISCGLEDVEDQIEGLKKGLDMIK